MKNILILFFTILFSISAKAEVYDSYQLTFTIENISGQKSKGYVHIPTAYFKLDSIQNIAYLKRALNWDNEWKNDSLTYFKERIKYEYEYNPTQGEELSVTTYTYYLRGKTQISLISIKSITIDEVIDSDYVTSILVLKETSDLSWLKEKPIKNYFYSSLLCEENQIFVYEKNDTIDKLINKLIEVHKEIDEIETNEKNPNYNDTKYHNELTDKVEKIYEKMKGYKIVVVSTCYG